ncbi:MAG: AAA family ATPase [Anaerolineae bacterium]
MNTIIDYVPKDRRQALADGAVLPDRMLGAALFADMSGFTVLTEAILREYGPHRGAERLLTILNSIYQALMAEIDRFGGSVIVFGGDALTVWFDGGSAPDAIEPGRRAIACARAMQSAMDPFHVVELPRHRALSLALKTTVACGPVRRFLVGDPQTQVIEVLAGAIMARLASAANVTKAGEVVLDPDSSLLLAESITIGNWREMDGQRCAIVGDLIAAVDSRPWRELAPNVLSDERVRPWLLPPVYARLFSGQGEFLTELRPTISLFLRFADLDYDHDDEASAKLDSFVRWGQQVMARYEGWLLQISIGDKGSYLYATFGAPIAHGDAAARAAGAALEFREPPKEYSYIAPVQIGIGGGVSRVGAVGGTTRTYAVMGDATNLAARLMVAAADGQVLMSANLAPSAGRRYLLKPLPAVKVKGKAEPIPIVAVEGTQAISEIHLQEPQSALAMIGRTAELAHIAEKISRARRGEGRIIGIVGEAGIGKSRLLAEAIQRATAEGFIGFGGAAQSTGMQVAFLAWQPIWRAFFNLDWTAAIDEQAAALERALTALNPALLPRLPLLGAVLGLSLADNELTRNMDAKLRKESTEALLVECLKLHFASSGAAPLLLVLEDAHWLDALSIDLLAAIGRAIYNLPVLLTLAYRPPTEARGFNFPFAGLPNSSEIELHELARAEAAQLVEEKAAVLFNVQPDLPPKFVEAIVSRTEGNPFYIEELMNYLRDRGVVPGDMVSFEQLELPGNLTSLILSRIDRLTAEQQTALKVASVIGRTFPFDWLWGVYPSLGSREQVQRDLDVLAQLDLTPLDTPEPNSTFLFKHATTQEVTYESMPFALRSDLHERLAAWLEMREETATALDLLAHHYGRSSNTAKQKEYFKKAGEAASTRYANAAAIEYYERLRALLPPDEQVPVLIRMGQMHESLSQWDRGEARYRDALELAEWREGVDWQAQAELGIGSTYWNRALYDDALDWLELARSDFERVHDRTGLSQALFQLARAYWFQGKAEESLPLLQEVLFLEGEAGDKKRIAGAYQVLGNVAISKRDVAAAREWWLKSIALQQEIGDKPGVAASSGNLAMAAFLARNYDEARLRATDSIAIFHELGARWEYGLARLVLGLILAAQGDAASARKIQSENLALFRDLGSTPLIDLGLIGLAQATQLAQPTEDANQYAVELIGAAARFQETIKSKRQPIYQALADGVVARAKQTLASTRFDEAWAEGYAMNWHDAVAYALARVDS